MLNQYELNINRAAQGILSRDEVIRWFRLMQPESKREAMNILHNCVKQSHPIRDEVDLAIDASKLDHTFTPCILLKNADVPEQSFTKIITLPDNEQEKSFILLLSLFTIADKRRRETVCLTGCNHEWHHLAP